ncbi:MAG: xanthine dehydrogenase family protein subunit M [Thermomicrobiales bacterium]|nr:xanthine dehydrogenase family protein subunit M [Thermomicrobiales bacterium]
MYPSQFEYVKPSSVQEAVSLLSSNPDAKLLAGGHSLIPAMKLRLAAPAAIVDLNGVSGLSGISVNGGATIGALTTYRDLLDNADLKGPFPVIAETANVVGDPHVRNRGTLGGSLAHCDPASDFTAVMLALGASVKAVGSGGEREIAVDDLFVDLFTTSLEPDEIITSISIPADAAGAGQAYEKHAHPASGYAVAGVAAVLKVSGGTIESARIAVTGAPTKATRATAAEQALVGKAATAENIAAAAALATDGMDLNGDTYASAEYRGHLVKVLAQRAITRAAGI